MSWRALATSNVPGCGPAIAVLLVGLCCMVVALSREEVRGIAGAGYPE